MGAFPVNIYRILVVFTLMPKLTMTALTDFHLQQNMIIKLKIFLVLKKGLVNNNTNILKSAWKMGIIYIYIYL